MEAERSHTNDLTNLTMFLEVLEENVRLARDAADALQKAVADRAHCEVIRIRYAESLSTIQRLSTQILSERLRADTIAAQIREQGYDVT